MLTNKITEEVLKAKGKATKAAKKRTTQIHRRRRNPVQSNITPVVVQTGDSPEAMIPATVKQTADSAEAVISVEVKRGNRTRRRAAVIPVAVRKRVSRDSETENKRREKPADARWSDPVTDSVIFATEIAENLIHLAHDFGSTVLGTAEEASRALFSRTHVVAEAVDQGRVVDIGTVIRNPRRAEAELRAA